MQQLTKWRPNPGQQELALQVPDTVFEELYGGARGGGKTDAGLVWMAKAVHHPRFRGLVIRRNADDLSDWVDRASNMYRQLGVAIAYRPPILTFPSGAVIKTGHLKDDLAYTKYQGHEYQRMLIEELTQIPTEKRYEQLISSCRSTVPDLVPRVFATTNPGGLGHFWVRNRFILNRTPNKIYVSPGSGRKQIFIPASIDDNPVLMTADPDYVKTLDGLKAVDEELWKAWRLGSWDVFVGQAFGDFDPLIHVKSEFEYPLAACKKVISFDWGYSAPGCAIWQAFAPENRYGVKHIYTYREIYQNKKTPEEWALDLLHYLQDEKVDYIVLPHDCFASRVGYPSIAQTFKDVLKGVRIIEGKTMEKAARLNRKALMHQALSIAPDGLPYWTVHPRCKALISTLPTLVYDDKNIEDIDSEGEDHAYDAETLGLLSERGGSGISGSVKAALPKPRNMAWTPNEQGEYQAPDFVEAMKQQMNQRRSTNNAEFR